MRKWIVVLAFALTACGGQATPIAAPATNAVSSPTGSQATMLPPATVAAPAPTGAPTAGAAVTSTPIAQVSVPTSAPTANAFGEYTSAEGDRVWGRPDAPVTLIDYSDFQ